MRGAPQLPTTMLVDLPNWVGDQMMAMAALNRLVEGNHGGETVLHTRPPIARFLSAIFPRTRVIASPRKYSPFFAARRLRIGGRRFQIGITLRNAARGKILVRLSARWCAGSRGEGGLVLLSAPCEVDRRRHQVCDANAVLAALGLEAADSSWRPNLPANIRHEGESALKSIGIHLQRAIGLAPSTARGDAKRWPVRNFGALATRLHARGYEPVIVIGPGEEAVAEEVCMNAKNELPVVGKDMDIAGLAGITAGLRVLVGNDSGPMQLAACLGTPVVAIFGPTDPGRTAPLGAWHRVVFPPRSHGASVRDIAVDRVEAATVDLLDERDRNLSW